MRLLLGIMLSLLTVNAFAASWHCRNSDLEIRCSQGKCELSEGFTPMDIRVGAAGALSVCAYSGCWQGKGKRMTSGSHILVSTAGLSWTGSSPGTADFMVAVDAADGVGFIKGEGYAMPITCSRETR